MSDFVAAIDWSAIHSFFAWPGDASVWNVLNSPILVTFLAALIGWQLNRRVQKAEEKAEDAANLVTLKDDVEAAEAATEEDAIGESPTDHTSAVVTEDYRREAEAAFDLGEEYVKERMKNAPDGRHRRTYKNISGASLPIKAAALHQRDDITSVQYQGAIELAHEWNQFRRGRAARKAVPRASLEKMRRSLAKLKGS